MNREAVIKKLAGEIRKISARDDDPERLKDHLENVEGLNFILSSGPVVCSVFNHVTFKFDYISPNVQQMLGITADRLIQLPYREFLAKYLHPEDTEVISNQLFPDVVSYVQGNNGNHPEHSSIHYNYRMKTASGEWIKIEQQTTPFKVNKEGKILLDQSFYTQVLPADFEELHPIKLSIFKKDQNGLYELQFSRTYLPKKTKGKKITERELEILQMLADGKSSREIGQKLNISETTVITHRRNMISKFNLKNTNELISFAYEAGLL